MRIAERRTETKTFTTDTKTTLCDLCGRDVEIVSGKHGCGTGASEVTLSASIGDSWGSDEDARDDFTADVCHECFLAKVMPSLKAIGLVFRGRKAWERYDPDLVIDEPLRP